MKLSNVWCRPFVRHRSTAAIIGFLLSGMLPNIALGGDPLSTNRISVPSGPGSIEGLGESFEPQLNTGTFRFSLPLKTAKLRGAVGPETGLSYNTGFGNGPVGMGWQLATLWVQRQTDKGLPTYTDQDTFIEHSGEELVKLADGTFRERNEVSFCRWENLGALGWKATRRDGTILHFGQTAAGRLDRPATDGGGTFRWMLESAEDTNGNIVLYRYAINANSIYLSEIEWGGHATAVSGTQKLVFSYAEGRPDPVTDYRGRFRCETRWRLDSVSLLQAERRVRHWAFAYVAGQTTSLLSSVTVSGDERAVIGAGAVKNEDYLPPIQFGYTPSLPGQNRTYTSVGPFWNVSLATGRHRWSTLIVTGCRI